MAHLCIYIPIHVTPTHTYTYDTNTYIFRQNVFVGVKRPRTARKASWNPAGIEPVHWKPADINPSSLKWVKIKVHVSSELLVQIKQKRVHGVENPLPRSFLGGSSAMQRPGNSDKNTGRHQKTPYNAKILRREFQTSGGARRQGAKAPCRRVPITTAKISNKFLGESSYISNTLSRESPQFQTSFQASKLSPRHSKHLPGNQVDLEIQLVRERSRSDMWFVTNFSNHSSKSHTSCSSAQSSQSLVLQGGEDP